MHSFCCQHCRWTHDATVATLPLATARVERRRVMRVQTAASSSAAAHNGGPESLLCSRRCLIACAWTALATTASLTRVARAAEIPSAGFRRHQDKLDGYSFLVPKDWTAVTSSGNDIFYRNPFNVNENMFVGLSSPSSRKFSSIEDLGAPGTAAKKTLQQYLDELGTTRLGVQRSGEVVSASSRTAADGHLYYDVQVRIKSYASRNQLAVYQRNITSGVKLEWDRRYITVLGVANSRLYEFRLQTASSQYEKSEDALLGIAQSFRCNKVET